MATLEGESSGSTGNDQASPVHDSGYPGYCIKEKREGERINLFFFFLFWMAPGSGSDSKFGFRFGGSEPGSGSRAVSFDVFRFALFFGLDI